MFSEIGIPIIDLSEPGRFAGKLNVAACRKLFDAFRTVGFVYLKDETVSESNVDAAFAWSRRFFDLPTKNKMDCERHNDRGYTATAREVVTASQSGKQASRVEGDLATSRWAKDRIDWKESYEIGRSDNTTVPNIWPPRGTLDGYRTFMEKFYSDCVDLQIRILRALEIGMGLPKDTLIKHHRNRDNQLRLAHYPAIERSKLDSGEFGRLGAHSDFGTITFLWQDEVGGLQIETPPESGHFIDVPAVPGTVVVNVGDVLQRWSNDVLRSALHRVVAPPDSIDDYHDSTEVTTARYSTIYFCGPDLETRLECLPGCEGRNGRGKYEVLTAGEYIGMKMKEIYG